jgi:hypothetical protein
MIAQLRLAMAEEGSTSRLQSPLSRNENDEDEVFVELNRFTTTMSLIL